MFTGIVEKTGEVLSIRQEERSIRLGVRAAIAGWAVKLGDSIAVNGCCLTAVSVGGRGRQKKIEFDLLRETWNRTNLQFLHAGALVNLERSLAADGRVHGHFVTGHIDGMGRIETLERRGSDYYLQISASREILRYIVFKGAVAVDGISLTVAEAGRKNFSIWIIPHTREITALKQRQPGDQVNLEADILAKYVEKLARPAA